MPAKPGGRRMKTITNHVGIPMEQGNKASKSVLSRHNYQEITDSAYGIPHLSRLLRISLLCGFRKSFVDSLN